MATRGKAEESPITRQVEVCTMFLSSGPKTTSGSGGARFSVKLRCYLTCVMECIRAGSNGRPRTEKKHLPNGMHRTDAVATFRADELASDAACRGAIHHMLMQIPLLKELGFADEDVESIVLSDLAPELAAMVRANGGGDNDYTFAPVLALHRRVVYSEPKALVMVCKKMAAATAKEDQRCGLDEEAAAMCPICLDALCKEGLGSAVEFPGCSHAFHGQCLTKWFHRATTCPMCRTNVRDKITSSMLRDCIDNCSAR